MLLQGFKYFERLFWGRLGRTGSAADSSAHLVDLLSSRRRLPDVALNGHDSAAADGVCDVVVYVQSLRSAEVGQEGPVSVWSRQHNHCTYIAPPRGEPSGLG